MKVSLNYSLIATILVTTSISFSIIPQIRTSHSKIEVLNSELKEYKEERKSLELEIENFDDSLSNIKKEYFREKIARNKLRLIKDSEKIYRVTK